MKYLIENSELKRGVHYKLDNETHCINTESDDYRGAEIWYDPGTSWHSGYKIEFNGAIIHASKTFNSLINRLNKLITRWHLELVEITEGF